MRIQSRTLAITLLVAGLGACESSVEPTRQVELVLDEGGGQNANVGSALAIPPVVKVVDANNQPMADVRVNFSILSGGGSIDGTSVTTDANGLAALGSWTIGSVGENYLTASVAGVQPLEIVAIGRCPTRPPIGVDGTVAGNLASTDGCRFANGEYTDSYTFTTAVQRAIRFSQASASVNSYLELQGPANLIAFNNNAEDGSEDAGFKVLLAPGAYDVNPSTEEAAESGPYTLSAAAAPENETGCEIVFAMPGVETVQTLSSTDCVSGGYRYDAFAVYLHAGRTYTITMNSPGFDTFLQLLTYAENGTIVAENDDISASNRNARIIHRARESGFYLIATQGATVTGLGNYTLIIQ